MHIYKFSWIVIFIPLILGLIKYKQLDKSLKIVFYFVLFGTATEVFTKIYSTFFFKNTMPIGHVYITLSFLIMGLFYFNELKAYVNKKIIVGLIFLFEIFSVINVIFIQSIFDFANITGAIGAMILFLFSIVLFSKVMTEAKIEKLSKEPILWINTAVLIYYSGNFFYYVLFNYSLTISMEFATTTVKFAMGLNILFYLFVAVGFLKVKKQLI